MLPIRSKEHPAKLARARRRFGKGLGFISKIAAHEANKFNAAPLVQLKKDVRRLLEEHKVGPLPSLASVVYHGFDHGKVRERRGEGGDCKGVSGDNPL